LQQRLKKDLEGTENNSYVLLSGHREKENLLSCASGGGNEVLKKKVGPPFPEVTISGWKKAKDLQPSVG